MKHEQVKVVKYHNYFKNEQNNYFHFAHTCMENNVIGWTIAEIVHENQWVVTDKIINALTCITLATNILLNVPTATKSLKHKLKSKSNSQDQISGA